MFRSGFHMCAKEILQYLTSHETEGDFTPSHVINHLHKLAAEVLQSPVRPRTPLSPPPEEIPAYHQHQPHKEMPTSLPPKPSEGYGRNCVPVIQRAYAPQSGEQSGSDTDTDSGYGGELEKNESGVSQGRPDYYSQESQLKRALSERQGSSIKQEDDEPRHKRPRVESSEDEVLSGGESSTSPSSSGYGSYMSVSPNHPPPPHPLCMPFYLIPPSAAAYLPMLEKCWYPGAVPMLYPGMGSTAPAMSSERPPPPQLVMSPRGGSPAPAISQTPMDSPALLQALKQVPPLNLETKDWEIRKQGWQDGPAAKTILGGRTWLGRSIIHPHFYPLFLSPEVKQQMRGLVEMTGGMRGRAVSIHTQRKAKPWLNVLMLSGNTKISYKLNLPCVHTHTYTWMNVKKEMFQMLLLKYIRRWHWCISLVAVALMTHLLCTIFVL